MDGIIMKMLLGSQLKNLCTVSRSDDGTPVSRKKFSATRLLPRRSSAPSSASVAILPLIYVYLRAVRTRDDISRETRKIFPQLRKKSSRSRTPETTVRTGTRRREVRSAIQGTSQSKFASQGPARQGIYKNIKMRDPGVRRLRR